MSKKYAALGDFLDATTENDVVLSFVQIEGLLRNNLPKSATSYEAWWSNSSVAGRHNGVWLARGWETVELNRQAGTVRFRRVSTISRSMPSLPPSQVARAPSGVPDPTGTAEQYEIVLKFEWRTLGSVGLDAGERLKFPAGESRPGLYRIRMKAGSISRVYFGESQSLKGRFSNYRTGSKGQATSHRIHLLVKATLASGGKVDVDVVTDGVTVEMRGICMEVDLSRKAPRCMVENAAIVVAGGEDIEIANK